jgi:PAS domain S-box-containing protein
MCNAIDGIIWEADADTLRFDFVGGSVEEILGYSAAEWLGKPGFWQSKLHPEDAGWVVQTCLAASRRREAHRLTYRMLTADGRAVWLQDNVKVTVRDGRATLSGIMIDVTELVDQRRQLEALNAQNQHFRTLYDMVPVAIWEEDWTGVLEELRALHASGVTDIREHARRTPGLVDGLLARLQVLAVNRAAVAMFGARSADQLIRRATEVFDADRPYSVFLSALDAILDGRRELEGVTTLRRLGGARFHVMYRIALPAIEDRAARVIICEMDVSEAHTANERFELVSRATSDVIWDFDIAADTLWTSDGLRRTFGLDPAAMSSGLANWTDRIHPDDRARVLEHYDAIVCRGEDDWDQEYRFVKGDGTHAIVQDTGFVIRNEAGEAVRMVGSLVDATEQRRLQRRLFQSQKLEALGKLTGGIAHDFNNLLTVILGSIEALEERVTADPESCRHIAAASRAVDRSTQLISQLLSYARQQPMAPRPIDMARQVEEMIPMIERALRADIELSVHGASDLWPCRADPTQFGNALLNLCINARDAMPAGGGLTIGMRNEVIAAAGRSSGRARAPGRYVVLSVADTGHGMDEATAQSAFDPFFTTKEVGAGSGLGLSMVQGFAQQSRGFAQLETAIGQGTVVELFLPALAAAPQAEATPLTAAQAPAPREGRVLLVEDEDLVRRHMAGILEREGYSVLAADTAAAARARLRSDEAIDLVLTDIVLPGGVSGVKLAEAARALRPGLPVVFTSGYSEGALEDAGGALADRRLLRKPFRRDELVAFVRSALAGR